MRLLVLAAAVLAIASPDAAAAGPIRGAALFRLSRIHVAVDGRSLIFRVTVSKVPTDNRPTLAWSLASTGVRCDNPGFPGGTRSEAGLIVWDQQGPTFRWNRTSERCRGTVSVVAENQYQHCTALVRVAVAGNTPAKPACALGGYAIGFSTLPVPAGVFQTYNQVRAQLSATPRNAAAATRQISFALRKQSAALSLFPTLWYCNFKRTFTTIVALRADLDRAAFTAAGHDARLAAQVLATCAPSSVRNAFERLAVSPKAAASTLNATLSHSFPTVFGFHFDDLVNRFAAEEVALAEARATTDPAAAIRQASTAAQSARAISTGLDRYQRRVVRIENAQG